MDDMGNGTFEAWTFRSPLSDSVTRNVAMSGCTVQNPKATGNSYSADMVCTGRMNGKGHTEVSYTGPTHMVMHSTFNGTMGGQPVNTKTDITADFISANCGNVKPFAVPKAAGGN